VRRRKAWAGVVACLLLMAACRKDVAKAAGPPAAAPPFVIKFSDPGNAGVLAYAKKTGRLDAPLAAVNARIEWVQAAGAFSANFEAMNAGAINTSGGAVSPVIGALSHNLPFRIFAIYERARSRQAGVIVPGTSPIKSIAELAGKRVAVNLAAHGDYLLLRALERAGVPASRVERVAIQPPDAAAAFATGKLDGWSTFGIFFNTAVRNGARVLAYEEDLESDDVGILSANAASLATNPAAFDVLLRVVQELTLEARQSPENFQNIFVSKGPTAVSGPDLALAIEDTRKLPLPHAPTAEDRVHIAAVAKLFYDNKSIDRPLTTDQVVFDLGEAVRAKGTAAVVQPEKPQAL